MVAAFGGGFSGYISANAEYATSTDAALNSKGFGVAAEASVLVANSIQLSAGAAYDMAFYGPNEGNSISANADVRVGVTENIDIFAGVNYGYKTTANPGWARNYGATVGVSLHN